MSVIIESGEVISKSPLNNSSSKMMYSFPKAERFTRLNKIYNDNLYNLPNLKSNRSTSFGYGTKYDFTQTRKPKPPYYDIPAIIDAKKPHSPAYTFGISREYYSKVFSKNGKIIDKGIPGPGKYDFLKPFGSDAYKFSLTSRREVKDMKTKSNIPGPGEYKQLKISPSGKYPVSSFRNTASVPWASSKSQRFRLKSK